MSTNNKCFRGKIRKLFFLIPILSEAMLYIYMQKCYPYHTDPKFKPHIHQVYHEYSDTVTSYNTFPYI